MAAAMVSEINRSHSLSNGNDEATNDRTNCADAVDINSLVLQHQNILTTYSFDIWGQVLQHSVRSKQQYTTHRYA
jgi:hypothetical protein